MSLTIQALKKVPKAAAVRSTYRLLLRAVDSTLQPLKNVSAEEAKVSIFQNRTPFAAREKIMQAYRDNMTVTDKKQRAALHLRATTFLAYLKTNQKYDEELLEAGWAKNRSEMDGVQNVAAYVGFSVPESGTVEPRMPPTID
jgi:hypothetical protein